MFERCPKCGKTHFFKPKVCDCGHNFQKPKGEEKLKCPFCNTLVKIEMEECPGCHKKINDLFAVVCPRCKKEVGIKMKNCPNCGQQLVVELIVCPRCKKEIDAKKTICPNCGYNFLEEPKYHCERCGYELPTMSSDCPICSQQDYIGSGDYTGSGDYSSGEYVN